MPEKNIPTFWQSLCHLVAAGESGGILDVVLQRLSNYMEKAMKLKSKVKGRWLIPPASWWFLLRCSIAVGQGDSGIPENVWRLCAELPAPTHFLLVSVHMPKIFFSGSYCYGYCVYAFRRYYKTEKGTLLMMISFWEHLFLAHYWKKLP